MRTALAGFHLEGNGGSWNPGADGGGWNGGGGGCGGDCSCGGSCGGGGACGCKGGGGSCSGKPSGGSGGHPDGGSGQLPLIPDYDGEIWASPDQFIVDFVVGSHATACTSEFCFFGASEESPEVPTPHNAWDPSVAALTTIDHQDPQDSPRVSICGPDITDWLVGHLVSDVFLGMSPIGGFPATNWAPHGKRDLKNIKNVTAGKGETACPQFCGWGVTLCDKCVSKDVPGNMGFGGAVGKNWASILAGVSLGDEDAADRYAYALGSYASAVGRRYVKKRARTHPRQLPGEGAQEAVKEAVCKALNDPMIRWPAHFFQDCKPCDKPWP